MAVFNYIRDPKEIYRRSFEAIASEASLERLPEQIRPVATRLIHSCGMVDVVDDLDYSENAVTEGQAALDNGAVIFTDVEMVKAGIIERFLPSRNPIVCTLNDDRVPNHAKAIGNTRSAAAVDFWQDRLEGSIVVIGNAPTALFRLLELIAERSGRPALIIGVPVGFVGAVESKQALADNSTEVNYITVHGRRGGSAMASSVLNGLAGGLS
ncbi:MAG: precorrin-8X methylmutase [Pseudomonadota bacterium]